MFRGGVADCALFDEKQFRFVEFKTNAEGRSDKAVHKTLEKAGKQLSNTIRIFSDSLRSVNVEMADADVMSCHIVLTRNFPIAHSTMQDYLLEFMQDNNGMNVIFSSETYWEEPEK